MPEQRISLVTLVVHDYDEAIVFYTESLGFTLVEDTDLGGGKRWVRVSPPGCGSDGVCLLLAECVTTEQRGAIGNQSGGRVFLFMHTADFKHDFQRLKSNGVEFVREPTEEPYGTVAVFQDLYGNKFDLIQPREPSE